MRWWMRAAAAVSRMNLYSGDFADYRMSADEYTQMVVSKYEILADSIARSPVSG